MGEDRRHLVNEIEEVFQRLAWRNQHQLAALLTTYGLTIPQFFSLTVLHRFGPEMTISEIGEVIQTPPSSMTSIVDRLERLGMIERHPHPTDRRATLARITDSGLALIGEIDDARHQALVEMLGDVPLGDLRHFLETLQRVDAKTAEGTDEAPGCTSSAADL